MNLFSLVIQNDIVFALFYTCIGWNGSIFVASLFLLKLQLSYFKSSIHKTESSLKYLVKSTEWEFVWREIVKLILGDILG